MRQFAILKRFKSTIPPFLPPETHYPDYPSVAPVNLQHRNPYLKYDDQQNLRNFGEPLHPHHDLLSVWAPDHINTVDDRTALRWFFTFFGSIGLFSAGIYYGEFYPERPAMPRTYPYDGLAVDLGARGDHDKHLYAARAEKAETSHS